MPRPADRRRLLAWSVFAALLVGQLGLGAGLILLRETLAADGCERRCPCDAPAEALNDAAAAPAEALADTAAAPAEAPADDHAAVPCPPGCDDCACCPGAVAAIITTDLPTLRAPLGLPVTRPPPDEPATGVHARLDRPPDDARG